MDEEANLLKKNIRDLIGEEVYTALVEEGKYGSAVVYNDKKEKYAGYYLVEWIGVPWTDRETRQLMCDAV